MPTRWPRCAPGTKACRHAKRSSLKAYDSVSAARMGLARYLDFYNSRRPHQSHDGHTPDMIYFLTLVPLANAA
jgi:Integrase core domain